MNIYWRNTAQELPQESYQCLVFGRLKNGLGYGVRYWNQHIQCWDDEDGDDYECDSTQVEKWIPIDEIEELPVY